LNDASNSTKSDNFSLSSLQQAPYSFLSPLSCKKWQQTSTSADQFDCLTREQLAIWGIICKLSTSLLTSLFRLTQLVNASLRRFCCTEFLWKGYQTLFFPTQTQKKKSGLATRDYLSSTARRHNLILPEQLYVSKPEGPVDIEVRRTAAQITVPSNASNMIGWKAKENQKL